LLIDNDHPKTVFKMILTGGEYAYKRDYDVIVLPLDVLEYEL